MNWSVAGEIVSAVEGEVGALSGFLRPALTGNPVTHEPHHLVALHRTAFLNSTLSVEVNRHSVYTNLLLLHPAYVDHVRTVEEEV